MWKGFHLRKNFHEFARTLHSQETAFEGNSPDPLIRNPRLHLPIVLVIIEVGEDVPGRFSLSLLYCSVEGRASSPLLPLPLPPVWPWLGPMPRRLPSDVQVLKAASPVSTGKQVSSQLRGSHLGGALTPATKRQTPNYGLAGTGDYFWHYHMDKGKMTFLTQRLGQRSWKFG